MNVSTFDIIEDLIKWQNFLVSHGYIASSVAEVGILSKKAERGGQAVVSNLHRRMLVGCA